MLKHFLAQDFFCTSFFFKFTMIANGNDQVRRMRTAFDPNDASLQVRLDNQKILKGYLDSRPFGGGIGHAGDKAQRFFTKCISFACRYR
jgi:hypothetical protein